MKEKIKYILVRFNYDHFDPEMVSSVSLLPGVKSCDRMYNEDPALANMYLTKVNAAEADTTLDSIISCETVDFAEFIEKPIVR